MLIARHRQDPCDAHFSVVPLFIVFAMVPTMNDGMKDCEVLSSGKWPQRAKGHAM